MGQKETNIKKYQLNLGISRTVTTCIDLGSEKYHSDWKKVEIIQENLLNHLTLAYVVILEASTLLCASQLFYCIFESLLLLVVRVTNDQLSLSREWTKNAFFVLCNRMVVTHNFCYILKHDITNPAWFRLFIILGLSKGIRN